MQCWTTRKEVSKPAITVVRLFSQLMSDKCFETLELITITYQGKFPTLVYNECACLNYSENAFKSVFLRRSNMCMLTDRNWTQYAKYFVALDLWKRFCAEIPDWQCRIPFISVHTRRGFPLFHPLQFNLWNEPEVLSNQKKSEKSSISAGHPVTCSIPIS